MTEKIRGGATVWARQTIESDVFFWRPDKWFKIWFFLVNKVNHKDNNLFKRGSNFTTYEEISRYTKTTKNQIDKFIRYAKKEQMLTTRKTTRGMIVYVLKYDFFQNFDNYETTEQTKHRRNTDDTINKNDKNDKNIHNASESVVGGIPSQGVREVKTTGDGEVPPLEAISSVPKVGRRHLKLASVYAQYRIDKGHLTFPTSQARKAYEKRFWSSASELIGGGWTNEQIFMGMKKCSEVFPPDMWNLTTVAKKISEYANTTIR